MKDSKPSEIHVVSLSHTCYEANKYGCCERLMVKTNKYAKHQRSYITMVLSIVSKKGKNGFKIRKKMC